MNAMPVELGMLVRDDFERLGIVCARKGRPAQEWIEEHLHAAEFQRLADGTPWWGVMPLDGGLVTAPEPMLEVIRPATYEDFRTAADHANPVGRKYLATLFPNYVDRVLAERRGAVKP